MNPFRKCGFSLAVAFCAAAGLVALPVAAQTPGRNITIVVPFTPGGNTNDILARLFAEEFKQRLGGQTVIVENKPGASGNIGAQAVAMAAPDGHTLLVSGSPLIQNAGLFKNLPYDPIKSFAPIIRLAEVSIALVVNPSLPVKTTQEFVDYLKAHPGQLNYSSPGHGTPHHLTMELFKQATGTSLMHIPARGSAPAVQDLVGGQVSAMFLPISVAKPLVDGGQIRILAIASAKRLKIAPDVPTLTEQGIKGVEVPLWYGLWAPAGTPPEIVARYNTMANEALHTPGMLDKYTKQGIDPVGGTVEEFRGFLTNDLVKWTKILKDAGIVAE